MAIQSREFIGIAEGIKSHEISTKGRIESLRGTISELSGTKSTLDSKISYLEAALAAAYEDTDEDGDPDYGRISAIEAQINEAESELSEVEGQLNTANGELSQSEAELENVMEEKAQTLFEIQERARKTSSNIAIAGGMYGAYSSVGSSLQSSMQTSLVSLSQAASILDGSVDGFTGGSFGGGDGGSLGGRGMTSQGELSTSALSAFAVGEPSSVLSGNTSPASTPRSFATEQTGNVTPATTRNFQSRQQSINPQKTLNFKTDQSGNSYAIKSFSNVDGEDSFTESSSFQSKQITSAMETQLGFNRPNSEKPQQKSTFSVAIENISGIFGKSVQKSFSGCLAKKNPYKKDTWDIVGSGYDSYCRYRENISSYTVDETRYNGGIIKEVDINYIEGIPSISTNEIDNPQLFWGRESGKDMHTFIEIASHIPEVKEKLSKGYRLDALRNDPKLSSCVDIYFDPDSPSAPTLYKGDGFYEFVGNGRHRILAARYLGYSFPMRVVGEIVNKNPSPTEARENFSESLRTSNFISHNTEVAICEIRNVSSLRELAVIAQRHRISKNVDFGNLDLKVSQQIIECLVKTKSIFPNLKIDMNFIGSIQARNEYLVQNTTKKLLSHYATNYQANNPSATREECKSYAISQTKQKLSQLVPRDNTIAQSISVSSAVGEVSVSDKIILNAVQGIAINESFGYSNSKFRKQKVEEVVSGHKPHGCNTAKATIDHEIGHQIANALNAANDPYIKLQFDSFVQLSRMEQASILSTYAGEDRKIGEFLAECWSEYQNNPECRQMAKSVCNRMIDIYNSAVGNIAVQSNGFERSEPIRER